MKVVRLSALFTGRLYPQEIFLVLISVRSWEDTRTIVWPEGLGQWKFPMTPSGIKPATFRLLAPTAPLSNSDLHHQIAHCMLPADTFLSVTFYLYLRLLWAIFSILKYIGCRDSWQLFGSVVTSYTLKLKWQIIYDRERWLNLFITDLFPQPFS